MNDEEGEMLSALHDELNHRVSQVDDLRRRLDSIHQDVFDLLRRHGITYGAEFALELTEICGFRVVDSLSLENSRE